MVILCKELCLLTNSSGEADLESVHNPVSNAAPTSAAMDGLALSTDCLDKFFIIVDMSVERPESRAGADLATEDSGLNPPWQDRTDLVPHEGTGRDGEDVVELLLR